MNYILILLGMAVLWEAARFARSQDHARIAKSQKNCKNLYNNKQTKGNLPDVYLLLIQSCS